MSSNYDLTEQEIKEGMRLCMQQVTLLLDDAQLILTRDRYISSGLYTYAIEELGKLLLLKKELNKTPNANNKISVNPEIFGISRGHPTIKFDEFKNEPTIPNECKHLRYVTGGVPITQHIPAGKVLIPITSGIIPIFGNTPTDFQLRKKIFYVDWESGTWVKHQDIEISDLQKAITELRQWMTAIQIP